MAICTQETAAIQLPGLCVHPAARHVRWSVSAEDPQYLFCKLLLLFSIDTMTYTGMKTHYCAQVSGLEEYKGRWRPGYIVHVCNILYIVHILHILFMILFGYCTAWLDVCQSTIVYKRMESAQVLM
jgi:hypothetical protein